MKLIALRRRARAVFAAAIAAIAVLLLGGSARAATASPPSLSDANLAYGEGRYAEAAAEYEQILGARGYSAPLLHDLGNAYLRDGQPVRAVVAYERAEVLAPRDPAIAANLAVARTAANVLDERTRLERAVSVLSPNEWASLTAGTFWVALVAFAAAALGRRHRSRLLGYGVASTLLSTALLFGLSVADRQLDRAVVLQPAPVLVSPFASAQSDFSLAPGTHIELGRERDAYVFMTDPHGRTGWLERSEVAPLVPPPRT